MIKKNLKLFVGILIGIVISSVGVYAVTILGRDVLYDNTSSGLTSTDVQGAVDELTTKVNGISSFREAVEAYAYYVIIADKDGNKIAYNNTKNNTISGEYLRMSTDNNYSPSYFALKPGRYLYICANSTEANSTYGIITLTDTETYPYNFTDLNGSAGLSIIALD